MGMRARMRRTLAVLAAALLLPAAAAHGATTRSCGSISNGA